MNKIIIQISLAFMLNLGVILFILWFNTHMYN